MIEGDVSNMRELRLPDGTWLECLRESYSITRASNFVVQEKNKLVPRVKKVSESNIRYMTLNFSTFSDEERAFLYEFENLNGSRPFIMQGRYIDKPEVDKYVVVPLSEFTWSDSGFLMSFDACIYTPMDTCLAGAVAYYQKCYGDEWHEMIKLPFEAIKGLEPDE